ncbi:hypothetical protein BDN71DRAFT_1437094 [Pleurotus eryngii]|uniref:RING-type domain-containing protein n=1 Tax=Pleurotus eryngii TaxID=5323 RepID=A0A9P5ZGL7_PLEER|nr:hypothetical protein BDN71DRAFT_1437094 [Pleurotus eryngii]
MITDPEGEEQEILARSCSHVICLLCITRLREMAAAAAAEAEEAETQDSSGIQASTSVSCPICLTLFQPHIDEKRLFMSFIVGPADVNMNNSIAIASTKGQHLLGNIESYIRYQRSRATYLGKEVIDNEAIVQDFPKQRHVAEEWGGRLAGLIAEQRSTLETTTLSCDNLQKEINQMETEMEELRKLTATHLEGF